MAGWFKRRTFDKSRLQKLFGEYELPNFPAAVLEVLRVLRDDESTNAEVAHALELDPGMSVRLIRAVNSAVFGLRQPVEELGQAVQLIGRASVESMLIAAAVGKTLPLERNRCFDPKLFWRSAGLRAAIAGSLADSLCRPERSVCWTSALLQDLAIPLLIDAVGDRYLDLLEEAHLSSTPLVSLERQAFEWDHAEIGGAIADEWGLPERLTAAIAGHHFVADGESEDAEPAAPLPVVLVADLEAGDDDDDPTPRVVEVAGALGVDPKLVESAVRTGLEEAEQFVALVAD